VTTQVYSPQYLFFFQKKKEVFNQLKSVCPFY
jgi:hypothetical protein